MKRIFMAVAVLAIVGGALAFKASKFADANIYCFDPSSSVNANLACPTTPGQPTSEQVLFKTDPGGSTISNPCAGTLDPSLTKAYISNPSTPSCTPVQTDTKLKAATE